MATPAAPQIQRIAGLLTVRFIGLHAPLRARAIELCAMVLSSENVAKSGTVCFW
jgi:hypothetical protein